MTREEDLGIQVFARPHELHEKLVKRFVKKVRNEGILQEAWERQFFEKPSVKRRKKSARARWISKNAQENV